MEKWEDFAIDLTEDDIYFDSQGDIAANYLNVSTEKRIEHLTKDIYHSIKVNEAVIISLSSNEEKISYIKTLFVNDTRIKSFDVTINGSDIIIENVEMR